MTPEQDLGALARSIIDKNRYMTLATADAGGLPWVSPVWYAPKDGREFFWVSSPEARHSLNLAVRPQLAIVIFDSHLAGGSEALYMSAVAEELAQVDDAIAIFSRRSEAQGLPAWTRENVISPARHRMYRATASEQFVLDGLDRRLPVSFGA
jgi:nitroimidazol reductase NimA-like FMN-containing flavoprotein (pyridoxamine 5'-phosphate oxidase superfamily)